MLCVLLLILFLFFFGFVRALFSSTYCISSRSASPHTILSFRVIFGFFCLCCVAYQFRFSIRLEMSFSLSFCFAFFFSASNFAKPESHTDQTTAITTILLPLLIHKTTPHMQNMQWFAALIAHFIVPMMLSFRCSTIFGVFLLLPLLLCSVQAMLLLCVLLRLAFRFFCVLLFFSLALSLLHSDFLRYDVVRQATIRRFFDIAGFSLTEWSSP